MCFRIAGRQIREVFTPLGVAAILALTVNNARTLHGVRDELREAIESNARAIGQRWLTTEEAALRLGIAERTAIDWIHGDRLRAVKVGGQWRIDPDSLAASAAEGL